MLLTITKCCHIKTDIGSLQGLKPRTKSFKIYGIYVLFWYLRVFVISKKIEFFKVYVF